MYKVYDHPNYGGGASGHRSGGTSTHAVLVCGKTEGQHYGWTTGCGLSDGQIVGAHIVYDADAVSEAAATYRKEAVEQNSLMMAELKEMLAELEEKNSVSSANGQEAEPESMTEAEEEPETETMTKEEPESETEAEPETGEESEAGTEASTEPESGTAEEPEDPVQENGTETEGTQGGETETAGEEESETENQTDPETESGQKTENEAVEENSAETETATEAEETDEQKTEESRAEQEASADPAAQQPEKADTAVMEAGNVPAESEKPAGTGISEVQETKSVKDSADRETEKSALRAAKQ